jgi:hypothetical protein
MDEMQAAPLDPMSDGSPAEAHRHQTVLVHDAVLTAKQLREDPVAVTRLT